MEKHAKTEKYANTFFACIKPKLISKSFRLLLFDWYIFKYVSEMLIAFVIGLFDSEDEGTTIVETWVGIYQPA